MKVPPFKDRVQAGRLLAGRLMDYTDREDVVVLGLPRGGVPVAAEVAKILQVPVDVLVVRKLGLPGWEELAMGAIASGGVRVINQEVVRSAGISRTIIEAAVAREMAELHRRELTYRGHTGVPEIEGKVVLLIDDGIATGSTVKAAVEALRQRRPARIIIAVPTAAPDACAMLAPLADGLIALLQPDDFRAVGQWYADFSQTTDAEVRQALTSPARQPG